MTIRVSFACDNAAFEGDPTPEVQRILRRLANDFESLGVAAGDSGPLYDANGNRVGQYKIGRD